MLLRSSSTPMLNSLINESPHHHHNNNHHPLISCNLSSPFSDSSPSSSSGVRRTRSDGNLHSLLSDHNHDSSSSSRRSNPMLESIPSFSVYNSKLPQNLEEEEEEDEKDEDQEGLGIEREFSFSRGKQGPLFLARGLGIDRVASGMMLVGGGEGGCGEMVEMEMYYKKMVDEDPSNALVLRNYAKFLYEWDDNQALMAVGVVDATSEAIFQTVMSLGPSRSEWDFCFSRGGVVEHLDSHTDVIHKKFSDDLIPWGMKRRDLLLQRYWRREDDGTYVILYQSVFHPKCHPERGCIRAYLKSGGFVITPVNQGKQSVVKHMMAVDWRVWRPFIFSSSAKFMTMQMLGRVAALREFFRAKIGNCIFADVSSVELTREIGLLQCETEDIKMEVQSLGETGKCADSSEETSNSPSKHANMNVSIPRRNDVVEEFFDVPDESEYDLDSSWPSDAKMLSQNKCHSLPTTAVFVHRLQNLTVERSNSIVSLDTRTGNMVTCRYGATLPNDSSCASPCTWATADPSSFLIRGQTYLQNNQKVKATSTLMKLVGADWLSSDKREDDLGGRPGSIVQEYAARGGSEFFFIVNIQVPGSTTYNLAFYYMMDTPLETIPLLKSFVKGDDAYRNSRFKLIPYISKGSWIVKQSVGKKACLVGQGLRINYFGLH